MSGVTATGAPSQLYQLVPLQEGTDYQNVAGQVIDSVLIDNYSPSYLFIKCANRYAPPLTAGIVFKSVGGNQDEGCTWSTVPQGVVKPATLNKGSALVIFTDRDVAESAGVSLLTPNQPVPLASKIATGTATVSPPPGTNTLICIDMNGGAVTWNVVGVQSGQGYYPGSVLGVTSGIIFVPIDLATDTTYTVTSSSTKFNVDASFVIVGFELIAQLSGDVNVNIDKVNNVPIGGAGNVPVILRTSAGAVLIGQTTKAGSLPVTLASDQGALAVTETNVINPVNKQYLAVQPRPTFNVVSLNTTIATAGSVIIAAPGVGKSIVLRKILFSIQTAPTVAAAVEIGTAASDFSLGLLRIPIPAAAVPENDLIGPFDYQDYLVGDNLPLDMTALGQALATSVHVTYCIVTTANWPSV